MMKPDKQKNAVTSCEPENLRNYKNLELYTT